MNLHRTVIHIPLLLDAATPQHAEQLAQAAQDALAKTIGEHGLRDGRPYHDPPRPVEPAPRVCVHCGRPARQPVRVTALRQAAAWACTPVCPPRGA